MACSASATMTPSRAPISTPPRYLRNAKIFAKLMRQAKPGDRIVVVYGAGHNYWLRHFAGATPGYVSVDPMPYLKAAAGK